MIFSRTLFSKPLFFIGLNSSQQVLFQLIALIVMTVAHILFIFDEGTHWFRSVSRFVYPAFAYLVVFNYLFRTSVKVKYMKKIFFWACISQPIYSWAFGLDFHKLNILFTLFLGLFFIHAHERFNKMLQDRDVLALFVYTGLFSFLVMSGFIVSYYWLGLTLLISFYIYFKTPSILSLVLVSLNIILMNVFISGLGNGLYGFVFFALILGAIKLNIGLNLNRPPSTLLYVYYPAHLIFFGFLYRIL